MSHISVPEGLAIVVGVGAVTYLFRAGLIVVLADRSLPPYLTRALRYVAPSVLAALVVSLVANPDQPNTGVTLAEVAGLVVGGVVAWRVRNLIAALAGGMVAFWVLLALT